MSRLPTVSGDGNAWGTILNDFLSQAHNADGSIKNLFVNVKDPAYGAKGDAKSVADGAITTGTPTLTSATAVFTSADVGKWITVAGAGASGADLSTTISAYVNATTVTLTVNAGTTVTAASTAYATDDTTAIQAAITALPACDVYDGGNNLVSGKTGVIFFPPGVYKISSLLTIPAGSITIQGSGMSSWIPIMSATPFENLGGTAIVTTDYTDGLMKVPLDAHSLPATSLFLRDLDLRTVSPASAQTTSAPPILGLNGWLDGEMSNVNVFEVITGGGLGKNLYKIIDCSPGAAKGNTIMRNVCGFGGAIGVCINAAHMTAIMVSGGWTGTGITAFNRAIEITDNLGNYFADLHCFSSTYGLMLQSYSADIFTPTVIHGVMFESVNHYIESPAGASGLVIIEKPCWNVAGLNPVTDIPSQTASTFYIITKYEQDQTGSAQNYHVTIPKSSATAGTSPYTFVPLPYDRVFVITTVGGMTVLTLDGQALFNGSFSVGQQVYVGAGHTLIATWATTAPVFELLPQ